MNMGFTKKFLPDLKTLEQEYKTLGLEKFVSSYIKYDVFIGSEKSNDFIERAINKNKQLKKTN